MTDALVTVILDLVQELDADQQPKLEGEMTRDSLLFGDGGLLDSMGLVALVIALEQSIAEKHGVTVALADERALSREASPYRTVGALAEYAASLLDGERSA